MYHLSKRTMRQDNSWLCTVQQTSMGPRSLSVYIGELMTQTLKPSPSLSPNSTTQLDLGLGKFQKMQEKEILFTQLTTPSRLFHLKETGLMPL